MADSSELSSWRKKLHALTKLPKPSQDAEQYSSNSSSSSSTSTVTGIPPQTDLEHRCKVASCSPTTSVSLSDLKDALDGSHDRPEKPARRYQASVRDMSRVKFTPRYYKHYQINAARRQLVPECLDTSSDFFNPMVSAEKRYETYLAEMHRREEVTHTEASRVPSSADRMEVPQNIVEKTNKVNSSASARTDSPGLNLGSGVQLGVPSPRAGSAVKLGSGVTKGTKGGGWKVLPEITRPASKISLSSSSSSRPHKGHDPHSTHDTRRKQQTSSKVR